MVLNNDSYELQEDFTNHFRYYLDHWSDGTADLLGFYR